MAIERLIVEAEAPVVIHSEESADAEGHNIGSSGFNYAFKTVAPVATPVAVGGVFGTPVTFSSRKITGRIHGQESVEGESSAADTIKVDGDSYLSVAPGPVALTYERTLHHAGSKAQGEGSFSYSYHADSPVFSAVPAAVLPASVAVVKSGEASDNSGSFAYSVSADAPVVAPATFVASAPVGVAVEQRTAGFGEKISDDSGSFSYSYHANAPILTAPVVQHSVIAAPIPVTSYVRTEDHVEDKGSHGAFSYSVTADAPLVGHSAAVVEAAQVVDTKSVGTQDDEKSSGSFSYSFNAEAPVVGAIAAPVVGAPVHTAYISAAKDEANIANRGSFSYSVTADAPNIPAPVHTAYISAVKDEANIANRGSFSYSVTADAPVVAPVSYVASAPVGVSYEHAVVESGDKISDDKSSGAFAYSYSVDQPAVVAPVVHHSVFAAPAYTESIVKSVDHVEDSGSRGAFSYSVTADAPLVGHSAAVVEAAQVIDAKSVDTQADDKSSGSFSYSFSAEAPVAAAVVPAPVHTAYTTSIVNDEAAIGNRGSFSYSVSADAPVVAPVSYVATSPVGVEYEQALVHYGDKISDRKGAFGYSYHVDSPAVIAPVAHHTVVTQPLHTESIVKTVGYSDAAAHGDAHFETKAVDASSEGKSSGSFSYSISAEAPVASVGAPVFHSSSVVGAVPVAYRGSFLKTDYVNPISAASLGVTADDLKLHSFGGFDGVYGVRTAPVETFVTGVQHARLGYGVPITIKCD
ncbi:hypothetical protein J437_LFUL014787 [Ladona fulva]|uniref:Uncharacterized protein n=1 Tax=Ladona fulva TaxID=123851 RepID=A0A8K0P7G0_LADFU|nr:hypothetical protein J437_LFUL014787 [Ladona fulva]